MVKVLANGELVADDDERVNKHENKSSKHRRPVGLVQHSNDLDPSTQQNRSMLPMTNIIDYINQRLTAYGAPTFSFWNFTFKPIVSLGFLLATLIWGFNGAIFSGLLYLVVYFSQTAAPNIPFIRNILQRVGLVDRRDGPSNTNIPGTSNVNMPDQQTNKMYSKSNASIGKKPFSGVGHKLSD